jgi:adenosylmethionine-8-amino-7-oxononanoate aminotransferase
MHGLFNAVLPQQLFAARPDRPFDAADAGTAIESMQQQLERHHQEVAAVILEPIVQAYGGMNFYAPAYLRELRALCDRYDVLLICDEIATGFGRTGRLFACEHAGIAPDILCLGKALTGGYLTLAATLCNQRVSAGISSGEPGAFMHGPTFMANPLACAIACASVELLISQPWQRSVRRIEQGLRAGLEPARALPAVADVRVLGAIGVIELHAPVPAAAQRELVERGVWVRPFGRLVYAMPPYVIDDADLAAVTAAMVATVAGIPA